MSQRRPPNSSRAASGDAGFTLIEVLVSLGVCGFVLAAIAPVMGANAMRARQSDGRLALAAAERAALESLPLRVELREGAISGLAGGVSWRMRATALPQDPDADQPSPWIAYRISIDLTTRDGLTGHVETIRLGKGAAR